jgi:hypothetical protein
MITTIISPNENIERNLALLRTHPILPTQTSKWPEQNHILFYSHGPRSDTFGWCLEVFNLGEINTKGYNYRKITKTDHRNCPYGLVPTIYYKLFIKNEWLF